MSSIGKDVIAFWFLCTTAICVGFVINQFRDRPLPLLYENKEMRILQAAHHVDNTKLPAPTTNDKIALSENLTLEQFRTFVDTKQGTVLDARPEIFHRLGHVPGAISLPRDEFETAYLGLKSQLEADKNLPIVIYCSGGSCEDSNLVRKALSTLGFNHIAIFDGGWGEWTGANLPVERKE